MTLSKEERTAHIITAVEAGDLDAAFAAASYLHAYELAHLIESLPRKLRLSFFQRFNDSRKGEILAEIDTDQVRDHLVGTMDAVTLASITETLATDEQADILESASQDDIAEVLASLDKQNREQLERVIAYPDNTAGGLTNTDVVSVRPDVSVDVVRRYLNHIGKLPQNTMGLIVVDRDNFYIAVIDIAALLTEESTALVRDVMTTQIGINVNTSASEVAQLFAQHNWVSAPVIDEDGRVIGRITVDDVLDVVRDEAEQSMRGMVGLSEDEDTFAPILVSTARRALWLGLNLLTALMAAKVIGAFEETIEHIVALAVLMPVVASMGGVAGSQTLILVTRGLALGKVSRQNLRWLLNKEVAIGAANGVLWAVVISCITYFWFESASLAAIIGGAIVVNLVVAAFSGVIVPMVLHEMSLDPALGGSVILTTITDVVGFWAFLGFATIWLL